MMGAFELIDGLVEPVGLEDTFVTHIAKFERLPGNVLRTWFYAEERLADTTRIIRVKLVSPLVQAQAMCHFSSAILLSERKSPVIQGMRFNH